MSCYQMTGLNEGEGFAQPKFTGSRIGAPLLRGFRERKSRLKGNAWETKELAFWIDASVGRQRLVRGKG